MDRAVSRRPAHAGRSPLIRAVVAACPFCLQMERGSGMDMRPHAGVASVPMPVLIPQRTLPPRAERQRHTHRHYVACYMRDRPRAADLDEPLLDDRPCGLSL